jgi:phospholipid/cholesterol/gamma-HCH transport system substrate-binding protein
MTTRSVSRGARRCALWLVPALALTGCSATDLPLPGGAAAGADAYRITVEFADVLDLVPQSAVKVNQVTVGSVEHIEVTGWNATVTLRLPADVTLPDNATAELKQTSLLGEKYVALAAPTEEEPVGRLGDGDRIPLARSSRNPEVEEVLGAMSLLLNGGGVAQLKVIEAELNNAMRGRSGDIKHLIGELSTFVGGLDEQKAEIVRAIDGIDQLAGTLAENQEQIAGAIDELPKGLTILADQREQLTAMLTALSDLGAVGTRVIEGSRADLEANLRALSPILTQLNAAGDNLPKSYQLLLTYPFPNAAQDTIKGDFTNLWATLDADAATIAKNLGVARLPEGSLPEVEVPAPAPGEPTAPSVPTVPGAPSPGVPAPTPTVPLPEATWTPLFPTGG